MVINFSDYVFDVVVGDRVRILGVVGCYWG